MNDWLTYSIPQGGLPTGRWMVNERGENVWVDDNLPALISNRRIIDLETRVANLEAALAKMEESK